MDRSWLKRRGVAVAILFPGYVMAWAVSGYLWAATPWLPWHYLNPYTVGALVSTVFNTLMWDKWTRLILRLGGTWK